MNVTLQSQNFNPQYRNYNNNRNNAKNNQQPAFTGFELPAVSKFLSPLNRMFDKSTTLISEQYTTRLYTSKLAKWLANSTEKLDSVVDHMQVMGSVIISGMYMFRTWIDKHLDEDRKPTLMMNQALTFGFSTFCGYLIDHKLDNIWENFTQKYAARQLNNKALPKKIKEINDGIIENAEKTFGKPFNKIPKKQKPALMTTLKYLEEHLPNSGMESKIRGMGVLKKIAVFGTVYRFLGPVFVTPIANKFGNMLDKKRSEKNTQDA